MNCKNLLSYLARNPKLMTKKVIGAGAGLFTKTGEYRVSAITYDCINGVAKIKVSTSNQMKTEIFRYTIDELISCGFIVPEKLPINPTK